MKARITASDMSEREQKRTGNANSRDRRVHDRFELNAAGGCLTCGASKYSCTVIDVSLSGCCIRTESPFLPGSLAQIAIEMPIHGMTLRMAGTTQWVTRENLIGIRFLYDSPRSKNQLAGLLTCLADKNAAEDIKAAVVAAAHTGDTHLDLEVPEAWFQKPEPAPVHQKTQEKRPKPSPAPARAKKSIQAGEAGSLIVEEGEWPAVLKILKDNSSMKGAIIGLNKDRCSFQAARPFNGGAQLRVEVEFHMRGLPFLMVGIIEDVSNQKTVDIRFIEVSFRKRQELAELIEELRAEAEKPASVPL